MLVVDGVYPFNNERPRFHCGSAPTQPDLQRPLSAIATRVNRALEKQEQLIRDTTTPSLDLDLERADGFERLSRRPGRMARLIWSSNRPLTSATLTTSVARSRPA